MVFSFPFFSKKQDVAPAKSSAPAAGTLKIGRAGEDAALAYLQKAGLTLIERNFRTKAGEIDLIMQDGNTLVFVEVRKRSQKSFGGAAASITAAKKQRLIKAAQGYLQQKHSSSPCRFDVIAIDGGTLSWLKNVIEEG